MKMTDRDQKTEKAEGVLCLLSILFFLNEHTELVHMKKKKTPR